MVNKVSSSTRREESLSRDRIVDAAIALLDQGGEQALTFRALSERLSTGAGALYWHVANKSELLTAACDAVVARALAACAPAVAPADALRTLALALFDAIDAHPWVGAALARAPGNAPVVRVLERVGQAVLALAVPADRQWSAVSALLSYILGVGSQNAANAQWARVLGHERAPFLDAMATAWSRLDAAEYPFTRAIAPQLRVHDDRADFLAGIDLLLAGIEATRGR